MPLNDSNGTSVRDNTLVEHIGADGTVIGNVGDRLKVEAALSSTSSIPHINRTDVSSAARTTSGNSGTLDSDGFGCLSFIVNVTSVSGTTPKLDVFLEVSDDNSNWSHFIQTRRFTATNIQRFQRLSLGAKYYRFRWDISGTTPSFTFSIQTTLKPYLTRRFSNKTEYDFDLTQSTGSVSQTFTAADSQNVSLITNRATDGGSGAQYKIQASNDEIAWADVSGAISQNSNSINANTFSGAYRFYRLYLTANANTGTRVMDIFWACNS